ncbi:MAG TPA: alpha/beta hydrolase [Phycisphaerae bacterium]|nr:alpha/beta hydrolase [Phycisphaerae bacterium]
MIREVFVVLWFTIAWRLAWTLWSRTVGRVGRRWVRWARWRRRRKLRYPRAIRLIPAAGALCAVVVFVPLFLSTVLTHRCKIADGQDPQAVFMLPFESVQIPTGDGLRLDGWFVPDRRSDRTIVICHGAGANKGNFIWFLGPLANKGYNVLFFDFRAHGASDGRQTTYGIRERLDVRAMVDWLKRERPEQSRIIVGLGSSQGAMALALAAAEDARINAVILDSPFVSPHELAMHHARKIPLIGPAAVRLVLAEMSILTRADFFTASAERAVASLGERPVMVIHGDDDVVMPETHARRLHDAARGPRTVWFGPGPHSNIVTTVPDEYGRRVFEFLDNHLGKALVRDAPRSGRPPCLPCLPQAGQAGVSAVLRG